MKHNTKLTIMIIAILGIVLVVGIYVSSTLLQPEKKDFRWLENQIKDNKVASISIKNDISTIKMKEGKKEYRVVLWDGSALTKILDTVEKYDTDGAVKIEFNDRNSGSIWNYVFYGIMILAIIIMVLMMMRNLGANNKQVMDFGRSGASAHTSMKVRFSDVAGAEEEKEELKELVEFLKSPAKFTAAGAKIPRGVLLVGPPGTGKTLFAKAVAGEANVPFFSISGSDFVEMYVGVGASRVRDLFDVAKKNKPCIIFIDEIDAVGRQRGAGLGGGHDEREQTLNQLLVQMDGFETNDEIIVIAATNRADILDPALLRPGRFDRQIYVNYPDVRGREAIFRVHSRNKQLSPDIDFQVLARITSGFTGADIANLLNEAAILAARKNRVVIQMEDIYEGINKVTLGPQKRSRLVTEFDKRVTAYHEAGHAIVAKIMPQSDTVNEVSIIPRGSAGGYTATRPVNDNVFLTLGKAESELAVFMAGRSAEEIVIKDITHGAISDIKRSTSLARSMVTEYGMSDLGPVFYGGGGEVFLGRDYGASHDYSDEVAARIDKEVERIITKAHKKATEVLTENRDKMDVMARVLIECETIYADEVDLIMQGKSFEEVSKAVNEKRLNKSQSNN